MEAVRLYQVGVGKKSWLMLNSWEQEKYNSLGFSFILDIHVLFCGIIGQI